LRIDLFRQIKESKNRPGKYDFIGGIFHALHHFSVGEQCASIYPNQKVYLYDIEQLIWPIAKAFFEGNWQKLYVHVPENLEEIVRRRKLCKPTEEQVFDVNYCDEYWIKCKVKMKCIGYISASYHTNFLENRPKVHFKYIEKYE
jgi:hypothetical protein